MKASEQFSPALLLSAVQGFLTFEPEDEMKATVQCPPFVLFILLYKVVSNPQMNIIIAIHALAFLGLIVVCSDTICCSDTISSAQTL